MAPEQLTKTTFSFASDVFAFGVLLFEIFAMSAPWSSINAVTAASKVMNGERMQVGVKKRTHFADSSALVAPQLLQELMSDCWLQEASSRPTMKVVETRLSAYRDGLKATSTASSTAADPDGYAPAQAVAPDVDIVDSNASSVTAYDLAPIPRTSQVNK